MRRRRILCSGFSLVEVVIATAVFATAIVGIIGLMSPLTKRVDDIIDSETASRLAESIQTELNRVGWSVTTQPWFLTKLVSGATNPIRLVANPRGDRVRLLAVDVGTPPADNALDLDYADSDPATVSGIADRDRYFLITLTFQSAFDASTSGSLALRADVTWPFQLPDGPASTTNAAHGAGADSFVTTVAATRQTLPFFFALTP